MNCLGSNRTYLISILVQFGVRSAVLTNFLLALVAGAEEIVRFEALQTHSACPCTTWRLSGLRFPEKTQNMDTFQVYT
jgi:hypothetical protein